MAFENGIEDRITTEGGFNDL